MTDPRYCLMSAPLGSLYTIDAKFLDSQLATGATLISRHETLTEAGGASCRLQLDQSRCVREDAAALGGKLLIARIVAVTVTRDEESRRCQFHLTTPSGGVMLQIFPLRENRELERTLRRVVNLDIPGATVLSTPIPVTLRLIDEPVRRDAQVARWSVIGVRQTLHQRADQLRKLDVIVVESAHWLVRDFTPDGVIVTRFAGGWSRPRPDELTRTLALDSTTDYEVERRLDLMPIPQRAAQMPAAQFATL